jgi:hypothetical protein
MLEQSDDKVQTLGSPPSIQTQFGKGLVYANTRKYPTWVLATGIVLCASMVIPLFLGGPPKKEEVEGISTPNLDLSAIKKIEIPFFSAERAEAEKQKERRQAKVPIQKYVGLQSIDPIIDLEIPAGCEAKAKIITAATDGPVQAELLEDLVSDGKIYLKAGAILKGMARTNDDRLDVAFNIVKISDKKVKVQAQALDPDDHIPGVQGSKWSYYSKKFGVAIGFSMAAGATEVLQDKEAVGNSVVTKPTMTNAVLNGVHQATSDISRDELEKAKKSSSIIKLRPQTEIIISFL